MNPLTLNDFEPFFRELHSCPPYDWQSRLARQVMEGTWPGAIDLPTGSGKTSCLDIALFALACQASWEKTRRNAPRRIYFCVNRRVIVDEAHQRAVRIGQKIWNAEQDAGGFPVLARAAAALRILSGMSRKSGPPLDVLELRGGIYCDNRWARSATQPTIVCTTIDQLGSRVLFRGYGVSPNAAPIQASLIAYDSLVLLDEAHISRPFLQTLDFVTHYLNPVRWAQERVGVQPMVVIPMTATPPEGVDATAVIRLGPKDRENAGLDNRLKASKPAKLLRVSDIVQSAIREADALAKGAALAVGIIVNRVATAKAIYDQLRAKHPDGMVELVIGSMRPIDRDAQADRLQAIVGPDRPLVTTEMSFVVATQCLEVGADYDFDALVTECASLDALRQRFGRLNRGGREIDAQAVILVDSKQAKEESILDANKPLDPIYGNALARTWNWISEHAEVVHAEPDSPAVATRKRRPAAHAVVEIRRIDFGIDAFTETLRQHGEEGRIPATLLAPSASRNAPVMLPAYVDLWCQTSPRPTPEPEVSLFLHGPHSGEPDVQVCWRADLVEDYHLNRSDWCDVIGLLPPTAAECMSVPISRVRHWLKGESGDGDEGDLLGTTSTIDGSAGSKGPMAGRNNPLENVPYGVLWRGTQEGKSRIIASSDDLRPGDTLVLPANVEGWNELGHVPYAKAETIDVAETAFRMARKRAALRLHPRLQTQFPDSPAITNLLEHFCDSEERLTLTRLRELLSQAAHDLASKNSDLALNCLDLANQKFGMLCERYPDKRGCVLTTRYRVESATSWYLPIADEGEDDRSRTLREDPISLNDHTKHVQQEAMRTVGTLPLDELSDAYQLATDLHDLGKADERFQAVLRRTDRTDTWLLIGMDSVLLAKSDGMPQTAQQRKEARERAGLPHGFRHEILSVQIADIAALASTENVDRALILHLIAAHHGYARPFAPVVPDEDPPDVAVNGVHVSAVERSRLPLHRIGSGISERFWRLTRKYGWWGLAYLETILRLADQQASADEDAQVDFGSPAS